MNDTEQLFLVAAVWTVIAAVIARFIPNWPGRIAFIAIAVGLPFWELPYGYYNFQKLCREEGALRILESIAPQESICVDYPFDTVAEGMLSAAAVAIIADDEKGEVFFARYPLRFDAEESILGNVLVMSVQGVDHVFSPAVGTRLRPVVPDNRRPVLAVEEVVQVAEDGLDGNPDGGDGQADL